MFNVSWLEGNLAKTSNNTADHFKQIAVDELLSAYDA